MRRMEEERIRLAKEEEMRKMEEQRKIQLAKE